MFEPFLVSLREALQCALLVALAAGCPGARGRARWLVSGVAAALLAGFALSYAPGLGEAPFKNEAWTSIRYIAEVALFYLGLVLVIRKSEPPAFLIPPAIFLLGFVLFFFEARALGFFVHDTGAMKEDPRGVFGMAALGLAAGFGLLAVLWRRAMRLPLEKALALPTFLVTAAAFKFAVGGVGEVEGGSVLAAPQGGIQVFLEGSVGDLQRALMLGGHEFLAVPMTGLAGFLSGESMAMALMVVFLMFPPLYILYAIFSRPDPDVAGVEVAARRRLMVAFFRRELLWRSAPVFSAFLMIIVSLHAVNAASNPLSEPEPMPLREAEGHGGSLLIPLSDRLGDFGDGRLRKYVYYYGEKRILFLAIMRPDGAPGVALDECEICKPAEWNKAAFGYAQRGEHLVCKYCMTPIAVATVNKPGGCNPIPLPFTVEEGNIVISLDDLIRVWSEAKALQKKGTHL